MVNNQDGTYRGDIEPLPMPDDNQFILPKPKATPTVNTPPIGALANPPAHLRPNTPIKPPQIRPFGPTVQINRPDPRIFPVANFPMDTGSGIQLGNSPFVNLNPNYWASRPADPGTVQSSYSGPLPPDVANLPEATFNEGTDSSPANPTGPATTTGSVSTGISVTPTAPWTGQYGPNGQNYGQTQQQADLSLMLQQSLVGQANNMRGTSDAGHDRFGPGEFKRMMDSEGNLIPTTERVGHNFHPGPSMAAEAARLGHPSGLLSYKNLTLGQNAIFQEPRIATKNILRGR